MIRREPYRGYVLEADPVCRAGSWRARVVIELHRHNGVHFQEVEADPDQRYGAREEAERASLAFGRAILDSRPTAE